MRIVGLLSMVWFLAIGNTYAQTDMKEEDKKEKKEAKKSVKKDEKAQSLGELAEESGKRIWHNVKSILNVIVDDLKDKIDMFGKKSEKSKEKKKPPKEDESKQQ